MLSLYHNPLSTCSQKVRLVLEYKNLPWKNNSIDLMKGENFSEAYLKINPKAQVPVLVDNGQKVFESTVINEYIDDAYPESSLKPTNAYDKSVMRIWIKEVDEKIHKAVGIITLASVLRTMQLKRPKEDVIAEINKIPDLELRKVKLSAFENGVKAPEVMIAINTMQNLLERMSIALKDEQWLAGSIFSLADAAIFPYVLRLEHLGIDFLWQEEQFSPLRDWIERVKSEPFYQRAIVNFIPETLITILREGAKEPVSYLKANL
jgi:glutathione S-transferase